MSATPARKRGRPVRLTREAVVDTALRLLADTGQDGFSMRGLADELGVSTAAVYHHFPTKAALFIAVLSARAEELRRPDLPADPRERLIAIIVHLIETLHRLPWVIDLLVAGESYGRAAMWILDEFIRAANELGATDEYAGYMYNVTWRYTLGELMVRRAEDERAAAAAAGNPRPRWTDGAPGMLTEFPAVTRTLDRWPAIRADYRTERAVTDLIDGLTQKIPPDARHGIVSE
ncbi:TetR/AcrR family transcriptional regulator [Nocardia crassostreae]|uniref:TetR/AcrR family transcriptional regulator n=1 Tax=Nocardia crassostreae TaxID=53428 RepID=UPI00082ECEA0|nr:TetR/AcrR family transcriptional regulator [Nocardia crassostreae]